MAASIIEQYEAQGYVLPVGVTPEAVERERARLNIDPIYVPIVANGIATAWGVPFIDGKPLRHP